MLQYNGGVQKKKNNQVKQTKLSDLINNEKIFPFQSFPIIFSEEIINNLMNFPLFLTSDKTSGFKIRVVLDSLKLPESLAPPEGEGGVGGEERKRNKQT